MPAPTKYACRDVRNLYVGYIFTLGSLADLGKRWMFPALMLSLQLLSAYMLSELCQHAPCPGNPGELEAACSLALLTTFTCNGWVT